MFPPASIRHYTCYYNPISPDTEDTEDSQDSEWEPTVGEDDQSQSLEVERGERREEVYSLQQLLLY